jgi:hypothetical protein
VGREVLEIDGDPAAVWCCGAIAVRSGGSMKFCTLPAGKCTVAAHQSGRTKGAKHVLVGDALYIPTTDKTALVSPFLEKSFLSSDELVEIQMKSFSVEQWIQLFDILRGQAAIRKELQDSATPRDTFLGLELGDDVVGESAAGVNSAAARVEKAVDFQTPRKPAGVKRTVTIKPEVTNFDTLPEKLEPGKELDTWQVLLGNNWNKLVGVVGDLEAAVPTFQSQCNGLIQGLTEAFESVEDKANALGLALGQRGAQMDAEGTVWDAVARSFSLAANLEEVIGSISADETVAKTVNQVDKSLKAHVGDVLKVVGQIHGSHKRLQDRMGKLENEVANGIAGAPGTGLSDVFSDNIPAAVADELTELRGEFAELRDAVLETTAHFGVVPAEAGGSMVASSEFHERLQKVEMRAAGESYISDQRVYASYDDVLNWIQGAAGRSELHNYWDVFSLLSKTRDDSFSTHEYLEGALMSERLKQNPLTSLVMSSLLLQMPGPFLPKRSATGPGSSATNPLPTVKTFDDWNTVQTGFNHQLQRAVTTEVGGLRRMLNSTVSRQDFELQGLAIHLLTQAQIQWSSMATWITDFYHRLFGEGGLTAKESWLIVGTSVQAIFTLVHRTRAAGHDAIISSGDPSVKAAHFLWATMQTHRLFAEIHLRNWDAHHCVQAVLLMHVVRNRITPTAFDQLGSKLDTLTRLVDKLDGRISTLEKKKSS